MSGGDPWNRNEGRYAAPSSAKPAAAPVRVFDESDLTPSQLAVKYRGVEPIAQAEPVQSTTLHRTPEQRAAIWHRLAELAGAIRDEETRAQYLAGWRARYDREISALSETEPVPVLHALLPAEGPGWDGASYAWPDDASESERRLIMIVKRVRELRDQRDEISEMLRDLMAMAKGAGFSPRAINALVRDIEADTEAREGHEAMWALYRRVLGVKGPMTAALMPSPIDARQVRESTAVQRRLSRAMAMIEARDG